MSKSRYRPEPPEELNPVYAATQLPVESPVAVYYRQSTLEQVGNISTSIQTVDMVEHLKQRGWTIDDIILIDMDAGVSGTKRIDERPGMSTLFELISDGGIGAVACEDEDRLFRDVTQIQVNIFIEACRKSEVLVITPSMVYDFANPVMGVFHARQFRFKSELAAEYINTFVKGKLHRAKRRLALEGRWFGGRLPPGFMIDMRKTLPDGSGNSHYRKYVPFEPYAEVVLEYFQLFVSKAGNLHGTIRHIHRKGPFYPDPNVCLPPAGYRTIYPLHRYERGFCPGETGLMHLLTNAVYIGHWMVNDVVRIYNNHPAIVPEELFWCAFNYLSRVTLEGQPNPHYQCFQEHARPVLEENRPVDRPLCAGMMVWEYDGVWLNVGVTWIGAKGHYTYRAHSSEPYNHYKWSRRASYVDDAIVTLTRDKLTATFDPSAWENTIASFARDYKRERKRLKAQLNSLEQVMRNLIASLETLSNPQMIEGVERRYEDAQAEHARLSAELADADAEIRSLEAMNRLKEDCLPALENWESLTYDEKRTILQAFMLQIEATPVDDNGLYLVIRWRDQTYDELVLASQTENTRRWLTVELDHLLALVDSGASQVEIARTFPDRTWEAIRHRMWKLRGVSSLTFDEKPIKDSETFEMYHERISGETYERAGSGDRWTTADEKSLLELVDNGATQIELAEVFPARRWWRIRAKITQLRGKGLVIPGVGEIERNETIVDYRERTGQAEEEYTVSVRDMTSKKDYPA